MIDGCVWPPYWGGNNCYPRIKIIKTGGSFIFDDAGNKIFDGISSWWSMCHGYNNVKIVHAMQGCLKKMPHVMFGGITHDYAETFAQMLCDFSYDKFKKTFFCDSGSVAVEVSIKMAIQFWQETKKPEKKCIVTFGGSYHGETFMASNLSSDEKSHLGCYVNNVFNLKLPSNAEDLVDLESFLQKNSGKIACSIMEPLLQGALGIKFYSAEILRAVYLLMKKYGVLFILDECATGFFRTGRRFAFDHAEITPDIVVLGKALSGGHAPIAAVCVLQEVFEGVCKNGYFRHGPTFMANPLACSAGIASLEIFNQFNYTKSVAQVELMFIDFAKRLKAKFGVEGRTFGAIFAVEINAKYNLKLYIAENISKTKLWVRPIGKTLYLMPPLNVEMGDLQKALDGFELIVKNTHLII